MLTITRLVTALVLFVVFSFGLAMLSVVVVGAIAAVGHSSQAGYESGRELGRNYGWMILSGSFLLSAASASWLAYSGKLPWCRRP